MEALHRKFSDMFGAHLLARNIRYEEDLETREGSVSRLLSINDRPLTAKQQEEENHRVQELMTSRSARRKLKRDLEADTLQGRRLFKMLSDAFVFGYAVVTAI